MAQKTEIKLAFDSGFYIGQQVWFLLHNYVQTGIAIGIQYHTVLDGKPDNRYQYTSKNEVIIEILNDEGDTYNEVLNMSRVYSSKDALKNALFPSEETQP